MQPRIEIITEKTLVGISESMSLVANKTFNLFSTFMPRRKEIANRTQVGIFDLKIYPASYFINFSPTNSFTKWAAVEVSEVDTLPAEMNSFILPAGKYAVFNQKRSTKQGNIFEYIFTTWLPNSDYQLDNRPHFDILEEKDKKNDLDIEEEIWIPIK